MKRKDTPVAAKFVAGVAVAYALSPVDIFPDFIPVLGYLDDIIILPILISLAIKLIPEEIMAECEAQAGELWQNGRPKRWYYALPIIALWLLIIGIVVYRFIT